MGFEEFYLKMIELVGVSGGKRSRSRSQKPPRNPYPSPQTTERALI
jgi:hypothetical protein